MNSKTKRLIRVWIFALTTVLLCSANSSAADGAIQTFRKKQNGFYPASPLIADALGNLYSTTFAGGTNGGICGANGCGTVYILTPDESGNFVYSVLYRFSGQPDGASPMGGLVSDGVGNLYGTAQFGGTFNKGAIFELSPTSAGWTEKILYSFTSYQDGVQPVGSLVFDQRGSLYGVTQAGGVHGGGTVFSLSPVGDGTWTHTVLHNFESTSSDASGPGSGLTIDAAGNLYGTTEVGGTERYGTVYEVSPAASGTWTEAVLYSFGYNQDGCTPFAPPVLDSAGNLYSTTRGCGAYYTGTVFKLSPGPSGWTISIIYNLDYYTNGGDPVAPVLFDSMGNLYGTAADGGLFGYGTIFKLTPNEDGTWAESNIHVFTGGTDGATPETGVIFGPKGDLYGTTYWGGNDFGDAGFGVVYEVHP